VLAAAVFATAFGALLLNEIHASSQFVGTRSSLTATQRQNDAVLADLAAVRQRLQAVDGQATRDTKALATDTAQLEAVQAALGHAQDNVTLQGSAISTLQSCLSGVEQALNALSVGDQSSAIAALRAVSADCQMAAAANG
jgi:chromosome segregation ATPase